MSTGAKNIVFIVNPFAGGRRKTSLKKLVKDTLPSELFNCKIEKTKYAGHAGLITKEYLRQGVDAVIAVGGDGTVNEISSELIGTGIPLGIVPWGSGNGLSMHLGIGRNKKKALQKIAAFRTKDMDTGMINQEKYFVNVAGIGVDGLVAYKTKLNSRRGFRNYLRGALVECAKYKNQKYHIEIDGAEYKGRFLSVNVANGSMFGYHFTVAPGADTSDGVMDALLIKHSNKINYLGTSWRFFAKRIHKSGLARLERTRKLRMTVYDNSYMHIDGEGYPIGPGEVEFEIIPNSLKVIY